MRASISSIYRTPSIKEVLGISRSTVEETVERVIKDWKKAAKDNPTDPVSAMVKKER